jgi:hypothetical protein
MLAESKRMAAAGRHYLGFELTWTRCEAGHVAVCVMMCMVQRQTYSTLVLTCVLRVFPNPHLT